MSHIDSVRIDKNIPLPPKQHKGGHRNWYPWETMDVGDSFVFPKTVKKSTAASLTYKTAKTIGRKFALRTMAEGLRCWRLK